MVSPHHLPLTDDEFDALEELLAALPDAPSLEELDGLMCAIVIGPQDVAIEEWLAAALGMQDLTELGDDAPRILDLVRRHEAHIASGLREDWSGVSAQEGPDMMYFPLLDDPAQSGYPLAEGWAMGFLAGLDWLEDVHIEALGEDDQCMAVLDAIQMLGTVEQDQGRAAMTAEQRDEILPAMAAGLQYLYAFWRGWVRVLNAPREPYRADAAPGRNDPCPCGSGRKFKKCCGAPDRMH